ncbi:Protein of unknown function [Pyronema omphalodes CBS 100304]|uniref:Uncharacterized protein n=1 Tax=Pyronema omphalodes (strain CBS 100304) TaxID=1076935 RepID=U4LLM6_PYROM|nr:Protein of unknown function [Pyronema omphalodes CBS 100304]
MEHELHNVMQELNKDAMNLMYKCVKLQAMVYPKMSFEDLAPQIDDQEMSEEDLDSWFVSKFLNS